MCVLRLCAMATVAVVVERETVIEIEGWWRTTTPNPYPPTHPTAPTSTQTKPNQTRENAFKEAEEEASIPASVLEEHLLPGGMISYRYQTKHGLSTKLLKV
jgi:hypothetical protein